MRVRSMVLLAAALWVSIGCGSSGDEALGVTYGGPMDDDDFPGACGGMATDTDACDTDGTGVSPVGSTTGATGGDESGCRGSTDCMGGSCVAPFDPQSREIGEFECRFVCVGNLDEESWCADDDSCCSPTAVCNGRGYCIEPQDSATTTGGSTSADTTSSSSSGGTG